MTSGFFHGPVMRVVIWMNIPSHHQTEFFQSIRNIGVDLLVRYYDNKILKKRFEQGWLEEKLQDGEIFVEPTLDALKTVPDYKNRLHVVPGYGTNFLRQLAKHLSQQAVEWVHWSECSNPGARWLLGYPRKRNYGKLVRDNALGAFAQGVMAENDFIRWGIPSEKIALLNYTPRAGKQIPLLDLQTRKALAGRFGFLFVGIQCQRKGVDVLLKAFAAIPEECRHDWALLLVGQDDAQGRYQKLANRLGLSGNIYFIGPVGSDRVSSVMRCAKVLILPSRFDGWGAVLNEAADNGLALIASDKAGASHHLISSGINGFRIRGGSVDSLRVALQTYVHNPVLAEKHGEASLTIAKDFTPEQSAQRFLTAIESWRSMKGVQQVQ